MSPLGMNAVKLSNLEYGVLFATLLFGATMVQTYHVLVSDSGRARWLKPLVATIWYAQVCSDHWPILI
jgi:hypothetical protein